MARVAGTGTLHQRLILASLSAGIFLAFLDDLPVRAGEDAKPGPPERRGASVFVFGQDAFLLGGQIDGIPVTTVVRYVPSAEMATEALDLELSLPRTDAAPVVTSVGVFIIGGRTADGQPLASVEWVRADASGSLEGPTQIEPGTGLNQPRSGHMAIQIGDWIYVLGGTGPEGGLTSIERAVLTPEGNLGRFEMVASSSLTVPRTRAVCIRLGSRLLVGGGRVGPAGDGDTWEQAVIDDSGKLGAFETIPGLRMTTPREGAGAIEHEGRVFIGGGMGPSSVPLRSTELATWSVESGLSRFVPGPDLVRSRSGPLFWTSSGDVHILDGGGRPESISWSRVIQAPAPEPVMTGTPEEASSDATLAPPSPGPLPLQVTPAVAPEAMSGSDLELVGGRERERDFGPATPSAETSPP